jgi:serine protease Do
MKSRYLPFVVTGFLGAAAAAPIGFAVAQDSPAAKPQSSQAVPLRSPAALDPVAMADVAEQALPSVVSVTATKVERAAQRGFPFPFDFGPPNAPREARGMGSGVVVSADGLVLTNNHVIDGSKDIRVTTADKQEHVAEVVGTDPKSDLAVLRVKGKPQGLKPITMGRSSDLRLGEVVLAIGNPFGVGQTVTMGIVSAKGRADVRITEYEDFIQTDAAINPGNSGGALVNMRGELVGINTAILSRSGGNVGIGFAIPTDMAEPIMKSLIENGRVVRGWLGIGIQEVNQDLASALGLSSAQGVLVSNVQPGSPAAKGGVERGDVIQKVDGRSVDSPGQLRNLVASAGSGKTVRLDVIRDKKPLSLSIALSEMPNAERGKVPGLAKAGALDGLVVEELTDAARRKYEVGSGVKSGVVVAAVEPGSPAARAGLRPGDVIVELNRRKVDDPAAFGRAWTSSKGNALLLVQRGENTFYIVARR